MRGRGAAATIPLGGWLPCVAPNFAGVATVPVVHSGARDEREFRRASAAHFLTHSMHIFPLNTFFLLAEFIDDEGYLLRDEL